MKKILLPTDFSDNAYHALKYAVQLYAKDECTFFLLHAYIPPISQPEYLLGSPAQIGLGDTYRTASLENLEKTRERAIRESSNPKQSGQRTDLLAMVRNRHSFFERLFMEPVIKKIGFHTSVPFMVFPNRADS